MRFSLLIMALVLLGCAQNKHENHAAAVETPAAPATTIQVGDEARQSVNALLTAYFSLKDALVEYDTVAVNAAATALAKAADSVKTTGITDSATTATIVNFAGNIAAESKGLAGEADLVQKKRSFSMITGDLYPLLQAIQYNQGTVYQQMCPMAFNDNETAFWLSNTREVVNPYLGKKHPKYAAGMLHCGEVKDSLVYAK